jgi:hypothetical protein
MQAACSVRTPRIPETDSSQERTAAIFREITYKDTVIYFCTPVTTYQYTQCHKQEQHGMNIHCCEFIVSLKKPYVLSLFQVHLLLLNALYVDCLVHTCSCPTNEYVDWMNHSETKL